MSEVADRKVLDVSRKGKKENGDLVETQTAIACQFGEEHPELQHLVDEAQKRIEPYYSSVLNPDVSFIFQLLHGTFKTWITDEGYIRCITESLKTKDVGNAFRVAEILQNADTGMYSVCLEVYSPLDGVRRLDPVSMSISKRELEKLLCNNGCMVFDAKAVHKYYRFCVDNAMNKVKPKLAGIKGEDGKITGTIWNMVLGKIPIFSTYHSGRIGWDKDNNTEEMVFKGEHIYTSDKTYSEYSGKFLIGEHGDYYAYLDMVKEEVLGYIPLETALALGSSATLLKFMNEKLALNLANPIVHMYEDSTCGKTTCFELILSLGGKPVKCEDASAESLFATFNSTADSLIKVIGDNNGFPCGFDELSMSGMTDKDKERILYALTSGLDKKRLVCGGSGLQKGVSFTTTIITNGEQTIMPNNGVKQGFVLRVYEFPCVMWTKDAKNAERIQAICRNNYGFITPMLAKYLLSLSEKQLKRLGDKYNYWKEHFIDCAKSKRLLDQYTERLTGTLALFMISLECFGEVTGLKRQLHYSGVFMFLFDNIIREKAAEDRIGIRAYQFLLKMYNMHRDTLWHAINSGHVGGAINYWGAIIDKRKKDIEVEGCGKITSTRCIGLDDEQAKELFVKQGKFSDVKVIMKAFNKMGLLSTKDATREYSKSYVFGNIEIKNGYQIYIPEDVMQGFACDEDGDREIISV